MNFFFKQVEASVKCIENFFILIRVKSGAFVKDDDVGHGFFQKVDGPWYLLISFFFNIQKDVICHDNNGKRVFAVRKALFEAAEGCCKQFSTFLGKTPILREDLGFKALNRFLQRKCG